VKAPRRIVDKRVDATKVIFRVLEDCGRSVWFRKVLDHCEHAVLLAFFHPAENDWILIDQ
jgi:hypothetical protein